MKAILRQKNITISESVSVANSLMKRVVGLMFKKQLGRDESLLIEPCNSIHTCFMNFPIDVLFLGKSNQIIHIVREMKPWRMTTIFLKSKKVLELPGGRLPSEIEIGDVLEFENV